MSALSSLHDYVLISSSARPLLHHHISTLFVRPIPTPDLQRVHAAFYPKSSESHIKESNTKDYLLVVSLSFFGLKVKADSRPNIT